MSPNEFLTLLQFIFFVSTAMYLLYTPGVKPNLMRFIAGLAAAGIAITIALTVLF